MTARNEQPNNETSLTMLQAYEAAYRFIAQVYERGGSCDDALFWVLMSYMAVTRSEPTVLTTDPAAWHDWRLCVQETLDGAPEPTITTPRA